jgi:hypothetical protein
MYDQPLNRNFGLPKPKRSDLSLKRKCGFTSALSSDIILIGPVRTGKSTVGQLLADKRRHTTSFFG